MARRHPAGQLRLWFAPSIANIAAPTVAEITAGTDLTPWLRRDGMTTPATGQSVDASDVSSAFTKKIPSTYGGDDMTLKFRRDDTTDTAYTTLAPMSAALPAGTAGFVVVRRFGGSSTAAATGQKVEVWPVNVISREDDAIADNEPYSFTAMLSVTGEPNRTATVA